MRQPIYQAWVKNQAPSIASAAISGNSNAPFASLSQRVHQGLMARGFSPVQSAALAGNIQQESGFDPSRLNAGEGGIGFIQWRLDRRQDLRAFAAARGKPETDFDTQLDFLASEMRGKEAANTRDFFNATDLASANRALKQYIRYGDDSEGTRLQNAIAISGGKFPASSGLPDKSIAIQRGVLMAGSDPEMQRAVVTSINQQYSLFNAETASRRAEITQEVPGIIDLVAKGANGSENLKLPDDLDDILPAVKARQYHDEFAIAQISGEAMRSAQWASPAELSNIIRDVDGGQGVYSQRMKVHADAASTGAGVAGADPNAVTGMYAKQREAASRRLDALVKERNSALVGKNADPAQYVMSHPFVQTAAAQIDPKKPETFADYAQKSLAVQDYLGVPKEDQHILTRGQAVQLASQVMQPGMDAKQAMTKLQQSYGGAWNSVFKDLVSLGNLPAGYQAIATLDNSRDASLLAKWLNEAPKDKDIDAILPRQPGAQSPSVAIKNAIQSDPAVTSLVTSLNKQGASVDQVKGVVHSIEQLAYAKSYYDRDPVAAQSAVKSFTDKYEFLPNGGARVPVEIKDKVAEDSRSLLNSLSEQTVAAPAIFGKPGRPAVHEYFDMLKANPTWINSPDASGLWLMDNAGKIVRDHDGKPLSVPFRKTTPVGQPTVPEFNPMNAL
jgi:Phage tail lysozyme